MTPVLYYWSSSEFSANGAVYLGVDARGTGGGYGFGWYGNLKDNTDTYNRVRPVLAF